MSREVHVPKSLISKIFEPFLKSCPSEVRVSWGRVPRSLTVFTFAKSIVCVSSPYMYLCSGYFLVTLYFCKFQVLYQDSLTELSGYVPYYMCIVTVCQFYCARGTQIQTATPKKPKTSIKQTFLSVFVCGYFPYVVDFCQIFR